MSGLLDWGQVLTEPCVDLVLLRARWLRDVLAFTNFEILADVEIVKILTRNKTISSTRYASRETETLVS